MKTNFLRTLRLTLVLGLTAALGYGAYRYVEIQRTAFRTPPVTADSELNKLNLIVERFKTADLEVITDGIYRKPYETLPWVRRYISQNFKPGDNAEEWIRRYCYQTDSGNIIYALLPDGSKRPLRDLFLEHLAVLETGSAKPLA